MSMKTIYGAPKQTNKGMQELKEKNFMQQRSDKTQLDQDYMLIGDTIYKVMSENQSEQELPPHVLKIYHDKEHGIYFGLSPKLYQSKPAILDREAWHAIFAHGMIKKDSKGKYGIKNLGKSGELVEAVNPNKDQRLCTKLINSKCGKIGIFDTIANHKEILVKNNQKQQKIKFDNQIQARFLTIEEGLEIERQIEAYQNKKTFDEDMKSCASEFELAHLQGFDNLFASNMQNLNNQPQNNSSNLNSIMLYKPEALIQESLDNVLARLAGSLQPQLD